MPRGSSPQPTTRVFWLSDRAHFLGAHDDTRGSGSNSTGNVGPFNGTFLGGSFVGFETFEASADLIYQRFDFRGSNAGETASGSLGPDLLNGRGGNDTLNGFGREDSLAGGIGNDILSGGESNDLLTGGVGRDRLTDGTGLHKFDFNTVGESTVGANHDTIVDFNRTQHDRIDLTTI